MLVLWFSSFWAPQSRENIQGSDPLGGLASNPPKLPPSEALQRWGRHHLRFEGMHRNFTIFANCDVNIMLKPPFHLEGKIKPEKYSQQEI